MIAMQITLLAVIVLKYVLPSRFRNTHAKVLAFIFVLNALSLYKQKK